MIPRRRARSVFQGFIESEASGGLLLMASAAIGMLVANSALAPNYTNILHIKVAGLAILHWVNDGLMAFFSSWLALRSSGRWHKGELKTWSRRAMPLVAALGGMLAPAIIFLIINRETPETLRGWAIPTATDIAFALGVLSLLGSRIPNSLKVFLTSLAIIDDLGAILIIAVFYTSQLSWPALSLAALTAGLSALLNHLGVLRLWPYLSLGIGLWDRDAVLGRARDAGGRFLAMTVPINAGKGKPFRTSPLHRLEHALGAWVALLVLPLFGFSNAGISLSGLSLDLLLAPLSVGIIAGLFIGKQLGIMAAVLLAARTGIARPPAQATWREIYGVAILCGIGFTMSLFIGLAFVDEEQIATTKLAVLIGSLLSALVGAAALLSPGTKHSRVRGKMMAAGRSAPLLLN
jgi:NhaA family Na+:H+ antiporter